MQIINKLIKFIIRVLTFLIAVLNQIIYLYEGKKNVTKKQIITIPSICLNDCYKFERSEIKQITNHFCCNPSLVIYDNKIVTNIRGVNYNSTSGIRFHGSLESKAVDTQNYFGILNDDLTLTNLGIIEDRYIRIHDELIDGLEDIRIFVWNNKLWALASGHNSKFNKNTMALLEFSNNQYNLNKIFPSPKHKEREKNWSPIVIGDELFLIYQFYPSVIIYKLINNNLELLKEYTTDERLKYCSGGTVPISYKEGYLTILHRHGYVGKTHFYEHLMVYLNKNLEINYISQPFYFEQLGVEFCIGLVFKDPYFYISYGVDDNKAVFIKMKSDDLDNFLYR